MILRNAIRCKLCGDVIESTYRHDFKWCKCGNCAVDGGKSYLKRCFKTSPDDLEELSVSLGIYEYNGEDLYKEHYLPDIILKDQDNKVENYPTDLVDADMTGIDSIETKDKLTEKWGEVNG